jgi:cytochrome c peroxidase
MGWAGIAAIGALAVALGQGVQAHADAAAGKGSFSLCEACHGVDGRGNRELSAPALAGLQPWYVQRQLHNFAAGVRGTSEGDKAGQQMRPMARALEGPQAVANVAAYIATLPLRRHDTVVQGDEQRGRAIYATCEACHGAAADGNDQLQAPALRHNNDWYLLRQLQMFKTGARGSAEGDTTGAQMRAIAATLPDEQTLRDVVAYITNLSRTTPDAAAWRLRDRCPPGFEQLADRTCELRTLYQLYSSAEGHGGLRAQLPPMQQRFTPEQIDLGRYLFFDRALSGDGASACADCHRPDRGFSDGRARSVVVRSDGRAGAQLDRNAPTLWNVGFLPRLFWDGRASTLQEQAKGPLFDAHEMANTPQRLEATLNANRVYRDLFATAFPGSAGGPIRTGEVLHALAAFESSLVSFGSRYDRYALGDTTALSDEELHGYNIFRGFVGRCSQCHIPPLFTDSELAVVGAPAIAGVPFDRGAGRRSDDPALLGAFKVPTLRNIERTAPYFNGGQFASLKEVLLFYNNRRGHAQPTGVALEIHWHIAMPRPLLNEDDIEALAAFLRALTDESLQPAMPRAVPSGLPVGGIEPGSQEACNTCRS